MENLLKKMITVSEARAKDGRYVIKDEKGLSYSFFEKRQDGGFTKAFQDYKNLGIGVNSIIKIAYKENESGKTTYRNIMFFIKPDGEEIIEAEPFVDSRGVQSEEEKWSKIREDKNRSIQVGMAFNKTIDLACAGKIGLEQVSEYMDKYIALLKKY